MSKKKDKTREKKKGENKGNINQIEKEKRQ
jgi:hypothetical protein